MPPLPGIQRTSGAQPNWTAPEPSCERNRVHPRRNIDTQASRLPRDLGERILRVPRLPPPPPQTALLCRAHVTDTPFVELSKVLGPLHHWWLRTAHWERGLGACGGLDVLGTCIVDESNRAGTGECIQVPNVDVRCLESELKLGHRYGTYWTNRTCQNAIADALFTCSLGPNPISTSWYRPGDSSLGDTMPNPWLKVAQAPQAPSK